MLLVLLAALPLASPKPPTPDPAPTPAPTPSVAYPPTPSQSSTSLEATRALTSSQVSTTPITPIEGKCGVRLFPPWCTSSRVDPGYFTPDARARATRACAPQMPGVRRMNIHRNDGILRLVQRDGGATLTQPAERPCCTQVRGSLDPSLGQITYEVCPPLRVELPGPPFLSVGPQRGTTPKPRFPLHVLHPHPEPL